LQELTVDLASARLLESYMTLLRGKDREGLVRAWLTKILAADRFEHSEDLTSLFSAASSASAFFSSYYASLPNKNLQDQYEDFTHGKSYLRVKKLYTEILQNQDKGNFGLDIKHTFRLMTDKIDQLKKLEDLTMTDLLSRINIHYRNIYYELLLTILLLVLSISLSFSLLWNPCCSIGE